VQKDSSDDRSYASVYLRVARVIALVRADANGPGAARAVLRDDTSPPQRSPGINRSH